MTSFVTVLPEADSQIEEAYHWWAKNRSHEQALRWFSGVWEAIESLRDRPEQWPLARENAEFSYEIRELHFGLGSTPTHRIIFTISGQRVFVVSVWHTSRDDLSPEDTSYQG